MSRAAMRRALAATAVAALALAFAPALPAADDTVDAASIAPLVTAADLGLDFAPRLVTVDAPTLEDRNRVAQLGLDVTEHAGHDFVEVVLHSADELAALEEAGFTYDVRIADLIARQSERIQLDAAYAEQVGGASPLPSERTTYRVLEDFGTEIDELVGRVPSDAVRISIGKSVEGRDLTGIEIGIGIADADSGERLAEDGRPTMLMFGAHHSREWPSAEAPMEFAHDLVQGLEAGDERITDLLSRATVVIVPVSNPDGFDASRTSGELVNGNATGYDDDADAGPTGLEYTAIILGTPGNAYKRKNCRYVDGQTQQAGTCVLVPSNGGSGLGIDLNRNYGALWGGPGAVGEEPDPDQSINGTGMLSPIYRGPAPFSEPETQAIRTLISTRQVTTLISNHTFSNLLLRPVGVRPSTIGPDDNPVGFAPDECFTGPDGAQLGMQELGERMTAQTGYTNQFGWELYDTTGTTEDYSYNATGGYGYTFEIGPDEFHPPYEEFVDEYTGAAAADRVSSNDDAEALTTVTGDDCGGDQHEHEEVAGGLREAYLVALENAADTRTHAVLAGAAPAGSTITVERTGTFPLWDKTPFEDTVTTSMQVGDDGTFAYHVNPSTRPFSDSRDFTAPREGSEFSASGTVEGNSTQVIWTIEEAADALSLTVSADEPVPTAGVALRQFNFDVYDSDGQLIATTKDADGVDGYGPELTATAAPAGGIAPGNYIISVRNAANPTGNFTLDGHLLARGSTERTDEFWSVTCTTPDGATSTLDVLVDRGEQVNLGEVCA